MLINPFGDSQDSGLRIHMPFLFPWNGDEYLLFSTKTVSWELGVAKLDGNFVVPETIKSIHVGDAFRKYDNCGSSAYIRNSDGKLVLNFLAGEKQRPLQMVGDDFDSLSEARRASTLGVRAWTVAENNKYRVVGGASYINRYNSDTGNVNVYEYETGKSYELQNKFSWVYRVSLDAIYEDRLVICGQVNDENQSVLSIVYDLSTKQSLGVIVVDGQSVYKPSLCGSRVVYAVRENGVVPHRYVMLSDDYQLVLNGLVVANTGMEIPNADRYLSIDVANIPPVPCHWRVRLYYLCGKFMTRCSFARCLSCPEYDSRPRDTLSSVEIEEIEKAEKRMLKRIDLFHS